MSYHLLKGSMTKVSLYICSKDDALAALQKKGQCRVTELRLAAVLCVLIFLPDSTPTTHPAFFFTLSAQQ